MIVTVWAAPAVVAGPTVAASAAMQMSALRHVAARVVVTSVNSVSGARPSLGPETGTAPGARQAISASAHKPGAAGYHKPGRPACVARN